MKHIACEIFARLLALSLIAFFANGCVMMLNSVSESFHPIPYAGMMTVSYERTTNGMYRACFCDSFWKRVRIKCASAYCSDIRDTDIYREYLEWLKIPFEERAVFIPKER